MKSGMNDFISDLAASKGYSLRRVERVLTQFGLCMAFTKANTLRLGAIVYVLCDLKLSNPNLFRKAKIGTLTWSELQEFYQFDEEKHSWFVRWLRYFYDPSVDDSADEWKSLSSSLWRFSFNSRENTRLYLANNVVDNISN